MEKPKSIVEEIFDDSSMDFLKIVAEVTGKDRVQKPTHYRNLKTGEEYAYIAGGIAWPEKIRQERDPLPGYAVIISIEKSDDPEPAFKVMEDVEEPTVEGLLKQCVRLRYVYGFAESKELLRGFYGNPEQYRSMVGALNRALEKEKEEPFHVRGMPDLVNPEDFSFFARRVISVVRPDENGRKRLVIGKCDRLRNRLQDPLQGAIAIKALGYVTHALLFLRPWERPLNLEPESYLRKLEGGLW